MDERVLGVLEQHEDQLAEPLALLESLQVQGELRYFGVGDYAALVAVKESLGVEIWRHRGDNV